MARLGEEEKRPGKREKGKREKGGRERGSASAVASSSGGREGWGGGR